MRDTNCVRVNALAPGRFLTPLTSAEMGDPAKYAAFVTGSVLVIDGGQTLL